MLIFSVTSKTSILVEGTSQPLQAGDQVVLQNVSPMFPIDYGRKILKLAGYPGELPLIGKGENGYVFKVGSRVVKVTSDVKEFRAARDLINKPLTHIVNIYDVDKVHMNLTEVPHWWIEYWGCELPGWRTMNDMFVIEKEYVSPLKDKEISLVDQILDGKEIKGHNNIKKNLSSMLEELERHNLSLYDLRGENIGVNNGVLKLFDLGGQR